MTWLKSRQPRPESRFKGFMIHPVQNGSLKRATDADTAVDPGRNGNTADGVQCGTAAWRVCLKISQRRVGDRAHGSRCARIEQRFAGVATRRKGWRLLLFAAACRPRLQRLGQYGNLWPSDRHSWLQGRDEEAMAAHDRGVVDAIRLNRGLPFDSAMKLKPSGRILFSRIGRTMARI
ncbi:hypothetical protein FIU90_14195 [Erythrobacter sp. THAF29]|nr:hypothetical protein FIU90_14195 [Erythrobacter sp. THAF29]